MATVPFENHQINDMHLYPPISLGVVFPGVHHVTCLHPSLDRQRPRHFFAYIPGCCTNFRPASGDGQMGPGTLCHFVGAAAWLGTMFYGFLLVQGLGEVRISEPGGKLGFGLLCVAATENCWYMFWPDCWTIFWWGEKKTMSRRE